MKYLLKLEEFAMFMFGTLMFFGMRVQWWWFFVLILAPDLGMLGYYVNPKVGSITYNILHHKAVGLGLIALGFGLNNKPILAIGIIIFTHSSMDRIFGFGLKYPDSFKNTHLGQI